MADRRCRPFTLIDAMILVAATGLALFWMRTSVPPSDWIIEDGLRALFDPALSQGERLSAASMSVLMGTRPLLSSYSIAALILRLRRPRQSIRRLARQPGFVFPVSFSVTFCLSVLECLGSATKNTRNWEKFGGEFFSDLSLPKTSGAVFAIAAIMSAGRLWRPESGWLDKLSWGVALCGVLDEVILLGFLWI